jgi:hypothetical protein
MIEGSGAGSIYLTYGSGSGSGSATLPVLLLYDSLWQQRRIPVFLFSYQFSHWMRTCAMFMLLLH